MHGDDASWSSSGEFKKKSEHLGLWRRRQVAIHAQRAVPVPGGFKSLPYITWRGGWNPGSESIVSAQVVGDELVVRTVSRRELRWRAAGANAAIDDFSAAITAAQASRSTEVLRETEVRATEPATEATS